MISAETKKAVAYRGFFISPSLTSYRPFCQLHTFGARVPVVTFARRETPTCRFLVSATESNVMAGIFSFTEVLQVIKVYLAGDFFSEQFNGRNWRHSIASGLDNPPPYAQDKNNRLKWGILGGAVVDCLDYTGPHQEHEQEGIDPLVKTAIKEADFVFAWIHDAMRPADLCKASAEIGYAAALDKIVSLGAVSDSIRAINDIWFAHDFAEFRLEPFISDTPRQSFEDSFKEFLTFFPIEKKINLLKKRPGVKRLFGNHMAKCGYVYLIRSETGHYKIGRTKSVPNRMRIFGVKLPFDFDLVHSFPCEDMFSAEANLHELFSEFRVNGEWFSLPDDSANLVAQVDHYSVFSEDANLSGFIDSNEHVIKELL